MRRPRFLFWLACPVLAFQTYFPPQSGLARPGMHHAHATGRFVTSTGEPVAGVIVQVYAGRMISPPVASTESGADGRFVLSDIHTRYQPELRYFPPEEWLAGRLALTAESGAGEDLGDIRLESDAVLRTSVELVGGPPLDPKTDPLVLVARGGQLGERLVAKKANGYKVFRQIPWDEAQIQVEIFTGGRGERYTAPIHLQRGQRDRLLKLRVLRDTLAHTNSYEAIGKLEIEEGRLPPFRQEKLFHTEGRLLAPDGSAISDALISPVPDWGLPAPHLFFSPDADGRFRLDYRADKCRSIWLLHTERGLPLQRNADSTPIEDCQQPRDWAIENVTRLPIQIAGIDARQARAYWWNDSLGWHAFSSLHPWMNLSGYEDVSVKIEADGYLPLYRQVKLPRVDAKEKTLPTLPPLAVSFTDSGRRELRVTGHGKPLAGALVDVELITDLASNRRRLLKTYRTPANGQLRLTGGSDSLVEVFVYADAYEPARAIWSPGQPLTLALVPRNATLSFAPSTSLAVARVRPVHAPQAVRTVWLQRPGSETLALGADTYDITWYGRDGSVAGYQRVSLISGQKKTLDLSLDQRPQLTILHHDGDWNIQVSTAAPPGAVLNFTSRSVVSGPLGLRDVPAVLKRKTSTETVFLLSSAGPVHVEARRGRSRLSLWRDVSVQPGEALILTLPKDRGSIAGAMRTYEQGPGSAHGYAEPRLQLIARRADEWSVSSYTPGSSSGFVLHDIPPGEYYLNQHLIGEPKTYRDGNFIATYTSPLDAWGGIPVSVKQSETTELRDFIDYPFQPLSVEVRDAQGAPLRHATLRVRDRLSDSWRLIQENPNYLSEAAHAIPYPPAVRIDQGRATLPQIRAGWLELSVELDNAGGYAFVAPLPEKGPLRLQLPARPQR